MKIKSILLSVVLISGILLVSCKKENDAPAGSKGSMSVSYNGTSWTASLSVQAVNSNGVINVTGADSKAHSAAISLFGVTAPGTYAVGANGNSGTSIRWTEGIDPKQTYTASFVLGKGTITISELSATEIKGTFSGTVFNTDQASKTITNGKFEAKF